MTRLAGPWHAIARWLWAGVSPRVNSFARCVGIAALLVTYADAPAVETFGRLFFSAEERSTLDDLRDQADDNGPAPVTNPNSRAPVAPVVDVISFDGKVERSGGGATTVWVNGRAVLAVGKTVEGISIEPSRGSSGETRFTLPSSDAGRTDFSLKVGQKIAVQSGKVLDSYEARAAEDAQSVFAGELPKDTPALPEGEKSPQAVRDPSGGG